MKIKGCKHYESKVVKMAEGGSVPSFPKEGFPNKESTKRTRAKLLEGEKSLKEGMAKSNFASSRNTADPRAEYVGNNRDIFQGANSIFANTGDNPKPAPRKQEEKKSIVVAQPSVSKTSIADQYSQYRSPPGQAKADIPKPKLRPRPEMYTIKAGDNPTKIANTLGLSLRELEAKNPGILKKAKRLKVGSALKV